MRHAAQSWSTLPAGICAPHCGQVWDLVFVIGRSPAANENGRMQSENELDAARFQGKHVAEVAAKLAQ